MPTKKRKPKPSTAVTVVEAAPVSFFDWPGSIDRVCACICAGRTLVDFCREFNQPFRAVIGWIEESEDRRKRYRDALAIRIQHQREIILRDMMQLRDLDPFDFCYDSGAIKPLSEIPEATRRWISSIKTMDYYEGAGAHRILIGELKEIKLFDKVKALEMLARILAMVDDKGEGAVKARTMEEILAESRRTGEPMQVETVTATRTTIGGKRQ